MDLCSEEIKYCRESLFVVFEIKLIHGGENFKKLGLKDEKVNETRTQKVASSFVPFSTKLFKTCPLKSAETRLIFTLTKTNNEKRSLRNIKN